MFSGSPWKIDVADAKSMSVTGPGLEYVHTHRTARFSLQLKNLDQRKLSVKILGNPDVVQCPG